MHINWSHYLALNESSILDFSQHVLLVFVDALPATMPFHTSLENKLKRSQSTLKDIEEKPVSLELADGALISMVQLKTAQSVFEQQTLLRQALKPLLAERPTRLAMAVYGQAIDSVAKLAAYVALVNAQNLPALKRDAKLAGLKDICIFGIDALPWMTEVEATAAANTLCRTLTLTPPNQQTPKLYRERLQALASEQNWQYAEWNVEQLKAMGAGAFVAVAQGSEPQDAAIVKLSYRHAQASKTLALVGKGICFDTGGHNLKSSKYMQGMHQDMNGSAVAVSILQAISTQQLPVNVDCWLALAQNHIGPNAYKQNDVVTALNGMTIEIVHTDAEGRMVLADTLTLASREKPDAILDFATLTGSMQTALGTRMSGIIANSQALASQVAEAGIVSGERVVVFPYAEDYDSELDSEIADIKQCTMESDADHIIAARFLGKFLEGNISWCHVDLSSYAHKDGLGAVASEVNGFGVALTLQWLKTFLAE
ncbi:leucyl aminopeptidase family protein [Methylophilus sp. Leaf414]|uniref:M17 family metallopeptidase n=1 Tax=Methylophilus sp. Leaf414 TaxID=1736371 RepID=UPI0007020CBA|nr:leucyl aminopeptidase family protein [Methylophilus sp. Leaf414]KQT34164.1 peptidase M17 [Methylophilus sp. Leaf414]